MDFVYSHAGRAKCTYCVGVHFTRMTLLLYLTLRINTLSANLYQRPNKKILLYKALSESVPRKCHDGAGEKVAAIAWGAVKHVPKPP